MVKSATKTHRPKSPIQAVQKQSANRRNKNGILKSIVSYLTSDSYMYGPLLSRSPAAPAPKKRTPPPKTVDASANTTPLSQNRGVSNLSGLQSPPLTSPRLRMSTSISLARRIIGLAPFYQPSISPPGIPFVEPTPTLSVSLDEDVLTDQQDDSRNWSAADSQSMEEFTPLHTQAAEEVTRRLVRKVGRRHSKELGIYVDIGDTEVERWFLATTFVNQHSDFELFKHMYKKLQSMGISKISDVLNVEQRELEEFFERTVHTPRMAARLQKLAKVLQRDHNGGISSFKRIPDYAGLKRELQNLPGYGRTAAHLFLRELRGVWPGAVPDMEGRTKNAAKHLHLVSEIGGRDGLEVTPFLINLAQEAGVDVRDLEEALLKLGLQHARQYRNCPGGVDCEFLRSTL